MNNDTRKALTEIRRKVTRYGRLLQMSCGHEGEMVRASLAKEELMQVIRQELESRDRMEMERCA